MKTEKQIKDIFCVVFKGFVYLGKKYVLIEQFDPSDIVLNQFNDLKFPLINKTKKINKGVKK